MGYTQEEFYEIYTTQREFTDEDNETKKDPWLQS